MTVRDPADRVRWWIAFALSAILVGAVAAPVVTLVLTRERNAVTVADEIVERIGERTSDLVDGELVTATQSVDLLSRLVGSDTSDGRAIDRILAAQVEAVPSLSGAFVGFPDGTFRFVRRDGDGLILKRIEMTPERSVTESRVDENSEAVSPVILDDDFDPRVRPWYTAAVDSPGQVWTDPYVFFASREPGVTTAVAIRNDSGAVSAVVGVDLALAQMSSFLDGLPIDEAAEAFIIAGDSVVAAPSGYELAHTDSDDRLVLITIEQIGVTSRELTAATDDPVPIGPDDQRLYTRHLDDPALPAWTVAVRTGDIEFVDVVGRQSQVALVATVVAAIALLAAIPLMLMRLRRPIDELNRRARFDSLTGLLNRNALFEDGQREIRNAYKSGDEVTVAVLDIDDFKSINDRFGHAVGDQAIRRVGQALRESLRPNDLVGRLGGDEFVVIMSGLDAQVARETLERVRAQLIGDASHGSTQVSGVTIGVAWLSRRALRIERLIAEADHALIETKRHAKGTVAAS